MSHSTTALREQLVTIDRRIAEAAQLLRQVALEHSPVAFASSFGSEDMVVLDLIAEQRLPIEVFTLDTGRLPEETHTLIDAARKRYGLPVRLVYPDPERLEAFTRDEGPNAFYRSVEMRQQCCEIRKLEPLLRVLAGKRAWVTGLRREQAVTRSGLVPLHRDPAHGLMKCNPLADWSERDIWTYIRARAVPYNALHDRGYPSIGCAPCTRAVATGDDVRSGRWWWERPETKECGLHLNADGRLVRRVETAAGESPAALPA